MTTYSMSRLESDMSTSTITTITEQTEDDAQDDDLSQDFIQGMNKLTINEPANPQQLQSQNSKIKEQDTGIQQDIFNEVTSTHRSISSITRPYQTPHIIQQPVTKQTINNIQVEQLNKIDYSTFNSNSNLNSKSNITQLANSDNNNKLKSANSNFNLKQYGQPQFIRQDDLLKNENVNTKFHVQERILVKHESSKFHYGVVKQVLPDSRYLIFHTIENEEQTYKEMKARVETAEEHEEVEETAVAEAEDTTGEEK